MMQRIRRMDVMQMAKTSGTLYLLLGLIIGIPVMLFMAAFARTQTGFPGMGSSLGLGGFVLIPVIYGICGFISGALIAVLYNLVAGWTGGIAIDLE
jgi:hypothetical protein